MIPELGHLALALALGVALVQAAVPLVGAARGIAPWLAVARPAALAQFLLLSVSLAALTQAFVANDFSVAYVASNANTRLPLLYRITGVWGGHEGSMLFWVWTLSAWGLAVALRSRALPEAMMARVLAIMGMIAVGFLSFLLLTSNPFERLLWPPADGRDLNPLLQDPGLAFHPPTLYMGYVGFSVAFAFAIAALIGGRLDAAWARWSRPWTTAAWVWLTAGIVIGSMWAYNELGWGGWWFWDPVENASFMPWLTGTALIHSLAVTDKRGMFKGWTVFLAILTFSLSLLGTFLVRSGVLTSVHAFASDPGRGLFILLLLGVTVGGALLLYALRAPTLRAIGGFALCSRETALLLNNVALVVVTLTVLLGTAYPLVLEALGGGKISVGPPYFNAVFVPLMVPVLFLTGLGPLLRWRQDDPVRVVRSLRWIALAALALGVAAAFAVVGGASDVATAGGLTLAAWLLLASREALGRRGGALGALRAVPAHRWGMVVAHGGLAVLVVGVVMASRYSVERDVRIEPGAEVAVGAYLFRFGEPVSGRGPNYRSVVFPVQVLRDGREVARLRPEKRTYLVSGQPMTEAAIRVGVLRDLYVALGEPLEGGAWAVRVYVKPFVRWIWTGGLLMMLGGVLAIADRRYRRVRVAAPAAWAAQEGAA
ncbi:heme lyase CcmF/NrfE family subunit [Inmirania thermothiophila]|uniref:Cytochrome c-type biogenesis protein CcmF n=1 Tax=Inmirania thermothiophila TaxID=1750597 RepID=A0A3N1YAG3_9GAMM|nr:heme lyase CcmF/NrfE family subunit [Inmirania thermothiophila]ROR34387.1 cytochrome c-type biogenesis protein CcmF [Inmirania thermothiophila]